VGIRGGRGKPKVLTDGTYATESAYTSTSTARLEAVKAAAVRSTAPPLVLEASHGLLFVFLRHRLSREVIT